MALKPSDRITAEIQVLHYIVQVLIVTHPDRDRLAAAIGKTMAKVENVMLGTTAPDEAIELIKSHMNNFRRLAARKSKPAA